MRCQLTRPGRFDAESVVRAACPPSPRVDVSDNVSMVESWSGQHVPMPQSGRCSSLDPSCTQRSPVPSRSSVAKDLFDGLS